MDTTNFFSTSISQALDKNAKFQEEGTSLFFAAFQWFTISLEAIERTTASERAITDTFANESDEDTASEPEPSSELTSMPPTVVSAIAMPEPEPSHELTSMPPTVVSAVASNASVQTQLGRLFTTTRS